MAPTKKPKSGSKRLLYRNEVSPEKDGGKSQQRKRKLSDKLGPRWCKEEIERFYQAYRKFGKDWKKVASTVHNRSVEMVEALYNMNRAYLSLPEGTASVVGLIAMMTDHYNNGGSDSEEESNDASIGYRKSQKRSGGRVQSSTVNEDVLLSQSNESNDGCLSLLKRRRIDGIQPWVVRKRTPRFPVSHFQKKDNGENNVSPHTRGQKLEVNTNDDEGAHVAALALAEALQRGGSPQVSHSPYRRTDELKNSSIQNLSRKNMRSNSIWGKRQETFAEEGCLEGSVESRRAEDRKYARDGSCAVDIEGLGAVEVQKGKKIYVKKEKMEDVRGSQFDDGGEACSGTEEGLVVSSLKKKYDFEALGAKRERFSPHNHKKRSKKLFFGDESSSLDALHTLADVSLSTNIDADLESSVQSKEEGRTLDVDDKSSVAEATSTCNQRDQVKTLRKEKLPNALPGINFSTSKKSKYGMDQSVDDNSVSKVKEQSQLANKTVKRKRHSSASKIPVSEARVNFYLSKPLGSEAAIGEECSPAIKGKCSGQISSSDIWRLGRSLEGFCNVDVEGALAESAVTTSQVTDVQHNSLPTKYISRRKLDLKKTLNMKAMKSLEHVSKDQHYRYSELLAKGALHVKEKFSCSLSSPLLRQWCTFEWFYSAIDYPWFAKREFVEYLNHVGLGHIPRLTHVEWSVIRSSLGKPRRFSERFLYEEREKLKQYRESVRKHYTELRSGIREGLPTDLARPLSVGQRVVALHPKTREAHDGSVLTVDRDKCRVQFDSPEIGVEFVMDIDCMPLNPFENMPEAIRRQKTTVDKFSMVPKELQADVQFNHGGPITCSSSGHVEMAHGPLNSLAKHVKDDAYHTIPQAKVAAVDSVTTKQASYQPCLIPHMVREADIRALSELTRALDKKEALLVELQSTNNEILERQKDGDGSIKDCEPFKKHYATVLVQLKEASDQVSSALLQLRQRNNYQGNSLPSWLKLPVNSSVSSAFSSSIGNPFPSQGPGSSVSEIVQVSRSKARTMVDAAIQAMSSLNEGEDAFMRIGEVLNSIDNPQLASDSKSSPIDPEQTSSSLGHGSDQILEGDSSSKKLQIPSELITSCVATLLMIQTCTERQYPPADVAQIIDGAVTSLHPCCPQNLQIYREIQMSMGRLKTQILALVPT